MGDVIAVQKKTFVNESGSYVSDPDGRRSYMYDFFLQIDLASVNRKKTFNESDTEEDKAEDTQEYRNVIQPSFINTQLGASMEGNDSPEM